MTNYGLGGFIKPGTNTEYVDGIAGAALPSCRAVKLDKTTDPQKWILADTDVATDREDEYGITMTTAAADGEFVRVAVGGQIVVNSDGTVGAPAFVSATAGYLAPFADLASGDYPIYMGSFISATLFDLRPHTVGVALP